jgi:predicted oxidoreductase
VADDADVIIVGAGLAGLVAAAELIDARKKVIVVDQEGRAIAWRAGLLVARRPVFGRLPRTAPAGHSRFAGAGACGLARHGRIRSRGGFLAAQWAEAYVDFAAGEKRSWLRQRGIRFFPVVGWAERGGGNASGHGNSVPRFHLTWGTGPGVLAPFVQRAREASKQVF